MEIQWIIMGAGLVLVIAYKIIMSKLERGDVQGEPRENTIIEEFKVEERNRAAELKNASVKTFYEQSKAEKIQGKKTSYPKMSIKNKKFSIITGMFFFLVIIGLIFGEIILEGRGGRNNIFFIFYIIIFMAVAFWKKKFGKK